MTRRRRIALALAVIVLVLIGIDVSRRPDRQVTARVLLGGIHLYQATLSPRMPSLGVRCRFTPTCSRYAEASIAKHGALVGSALAAARLARCGPWTPQGTYDPP